MREDYRHDIDGLRAVAVLAVIVYHLNPRYLPGGYAGVDIFFVISGFLITGIIRRELVEGRFSFWEFYARRVRRIYPALLVVILATLAAAYLLMLPPDYALLGDSAKWAAAGLSNFFFLFQAGYFGPDAARLPLLHTWSLGVEEQFYLVWPLLAWLAYRLWPGTRTLAGFAIAIVAASLVYAVVLRPLDADLAFYSPLARAWELGMGAAVALLPPLRGRMLGQVASTLGAVLVLACLVLARGSAAPALLLAGCLGATLLVMPKEADTLVGRALAIPPARFVGQISYSLYLWHWPLLILWSHFLLLRDRLPVSLYLPYAAILLVLAVASWRFIERPFRAWRAPSRWTVGIGTAAAAAVVLLGLGLTASQGLPWRVPEKALHYASYLEDHRIDAPTVRCWTSVNVDPSRFEEDRCVKIDRKRPNVLLIGDSHANQFSRAMRLVFPEVRISYVGAKGCYPLLHATGAELCTAMMDRVFDNYIPNKPFDAVILSARWVDNARLEQLPATIDYIRKFGGDPIILGPNQEYTQDLPTLLAYSVIRGPSVLDGKESNAKVVTGEAAVRRIAMEQGATYYSTFEIGCSASPCTRLTPEDDPMLFDDNHLSGAGALYVLRALRANGLLAGLLPD
jgi:peptidoglycan/LPS O-acetylase OafA/YrhL